MSDRKKSLTRQNFWVKKGLYVFEIRLSLNQLFIKSNVEHTAMNLHLIKLNRMTEIPSNSQSAASSYFSTCFTGFYNSFCGEVGGTIL